MKIRIYSHSSVLPPPLVSVFALCLSVLALLSFANSSLASPQSGGTLILAAGTLALTTPDPPNVTVTPCDDLDGMVFSPDQPHPIPASEIEVIVRNSANQPIVGASVVVEVGAANPVCPDAVLVAVTDDLGRAYLTLAGGGCRENQPLSGIIEANGVTIRAYENVKSPDSDGAGGDLQVNLADLVAFSNEFRGSAPAACHDYDNNGESNLGDLVIFSPAFVSGNHCP